MKTLYAEELDNVEPGAGIAPRIEFVAIPINGITLAGELVVPDHARGLVIVIAANGYVRETPHYPKLARHLEARGMATLVIHLLTRAEAAKDEHTGYWSFDLELLSRRLVLATRWIMRDARLSGLGIGYLAASTGAAAALVAGVQLGPIVAAVVARGGRPDLARDYFEKATAATLLIVGERDHVLCDLNRQASSHLRCPVELAVVPGTDHLFDESGALEKLAALAAHWFEAHLKPMAAISTGRSA